MSKYSLRTVIVLFLFGNILSSCSSTNLLTLSVTEPAPVYLPTSIETIGILNRSLPSEKNQTLDNIDKILSMEGKNLDKDGAEKSVLGVLDELKLMNLYTNVKIIDSLNILRTGLGVFPSPLSWDEIERISTINDVDAIFELSFFDTDAQIDYKALPVKIKTAIGVDVPVIEHRATIKTLIKTGWRIYDPLNKLIRDEYIIHKNSISQGTGVNPAYAVEAIIGRKEAVLKISKEIGHNYALRTLPYKIRVSRDYFVRGTDNFKIAKRRAQTGNWHGAAELWEKEVSSSHSKIAGRACYNMAIINEINGDLNKAIEWASISYTDYKNKNALRYINILKRRVKKNRQLPLQHD
ncbi:MAG: DUF6340 family protein [Flavobacteriaceae bacterium]|nr:DUF6340 family protein [Flavobacteriaceae bacterium]